MTNPMDGKIRFEGNIFPTNIGIKALYSGVKLIFHKISELRKNCCNIGFMSHRVEPNVFGVVVNKNNKIFGAINANVMRGTPNIRVKQFYRSGASKTMCIKWLLMSFILRT